MSTPLGLCGWFGPGDLPKPPIPGPRRRNPPPTNGCTAVPDQPLWGPFLGGTCDGHDEAYGTPGVPRRVADTDFFYEMLDEAWDSDSLLENVAGTFWACTYYVGVRLIGYPFYNDAQEQGRQEGWIP